MLTKEQKHIEISKLHQTPINKSKINLEVNQLIIRNHDQLYCKLVRIENDRDIFNDVVLSMTYKFKGENFVEEFIKEFRSHKARIRKAELVNQCKFRSLEDGEVEVPVEDIKD